MKVVTVTCPHCGFTYDLVNNRKVRVRCQNCGKGFYVHLNSHGDTE